MITRETAAEIWECYREIAAAEKLLADIAKERAEPFHNSKFEPTLKDVFGRRQRLQLGVPSGDNSHRLFSVSTSLGESVIRAHIADKQAALVQANEQARIEIDLDATGRPARAEEPVSVTAVD